MAGPDFLSQLPSLDELLEQPRVKAAIERLNHSTAATRARTALSGLGAEIARRAEEIQSMAPTDLLDKLVRRISDPIPPIASEKINATGQLFGPLWLGAPLPALAIEAIHATAAGFRPIHQSNASGVAKRVIGCDGAAVFSSRVAGLAAALESLAGGGVVIVGRAEMSEVSAGVRLDSICRRAGTALREIGATDSATVDDYEQAINAAKAEGIERVVVLKRLCDSVRADSGVTPSELSALAHRLGTTCLVDSPATFPRNDTPTYGSQASSAQAILSDGADALLMDTGGRIGGPRGALLVGKKSLIATVEGSQAGMAEAVDPTLDAALAATLTLFEQADTLRFTHPLYQLLDTPIENLRSRAERLAPQIAAGDRVTEAMPEAVDAVDGWPASWRVRVVGKDGLETLTEAMTNQDTDITYGIDNQAVSLDLRTVLPGQDRKITAIFAPNQAEKEPLQA